MSGGLLKNGVIEYAGANVPGWTSNLDVDLTAGTFTIRGTNGERLRPNRPGSITMPSYTNPGRMVSLPVTANFSFNDDTHISSHLTNFGFGITEANDWQQDMPFPIYAINRNDTPFNGADGNSTLCIARNPCMTRTPVTSSRIGDTAAIAGTDDEHSILVMGSITEANYIARPCLLIGFLMMKWNTGTTDWTVSSFIAGSNVGIGSQALNRLFASEWIFPISQNGAATNTWVHANGGTAPIMGASTTEYRYTLRPSGIMDVSTFLNGDGGTDGIGAVTTRLSLPAALACESSGSVVQYIAAGACQGATTITTPTSTVAFLQKGVRYAELNYMSAATTFSPIQNGMFTAGARFIDLSFAYRGWVPLPP